MQGLQGRMDEEFVAPLPVVLLIAGVLVIATAPWAADAGGALGLPFAFASVALGTATLGGALLLQARPMPRVAYPLVSLLASAYVLADLTYVRLSGQPQFNSELWLLLGSGFLILRRKWLHPVMATGVVGWVVLFWGERHVPAVGQYGFLVAAGVFFGYLANAMRRNAVMRVAGARMAQEDSTTAVQAALREIKASEKRLQVLTEGSPLGIFHTDTRGLVDYANARWGEIAGCDFHDFEAIRQAVHPDDRPELTRKWRACMAQGTELLAEFRYVHHDGAVVHCSTRATPLRDEAGAVVGWAGTLEDITQRVKAADADRVAFARLLEIEQLKEIDRFKTRILNAASHELNTPLTPLKLQVHLLNSGALGPLTAAQRKAIGILDRNLLRLATLVSDVLDVARLQGGHLRLETSPVDLAQEVAEAHESFEAAAHDAGLDLVLRVEQSPRVQGDPVRLSQVLYNLLSNAIKFTPSGGRIAVWVREQEGMAQVDVEDSGCGMRPDQLARLFQPFSQVHEQAQARQAGTGLGLYISRGIAEQHGGSLVAHSRGPGLGATFRLRLPRLAPAPEGDGSAPDAGVGAAAPPAQEASDGHGPPARVADVRPAPPPNAAAFTPLG